MGDFTQNTWKLTVELGNITFTPRWQEFEPDGKPTSKFRTTIEERAITVKDMPVQLQVMLDDFVRGVLEQK